MYQIKEFPKERMLQLRKEMGVPEAHENRMAAIRLLNQHKDKEDLDTVFRWMDETEAEYKAILSNYRVVLNKEVDAWNEAEMAKFNADLEAAHKSFAEELDRKLKEAIAKFCA